MTRVIVTRPYHGIRYHDQRHQNQPANVPPALDQQGQVCARPPWRPGFAPKPSTGIHWVAPCTAAAERYARPAVLGGGYYTVLGKNPLQLVWWFQKK